MSVHSGASQPLGFQSRDLNVFKGKYLIIWDRGTIANHLTRH